MSSDDGNRIRWRHEELAAQNHVAVCIPITGSPKVRYGAGWLHAKAHAVDQVVCIGEVGVRVDAPKIRLGVTVLQAAGVSP